MLLLRKIPLSSKTLVISRVTWEKALLKYCSGEGDLLSEAQDLQDRGYAGLGIAVRYNSEQIFLLISSGPTYTDYRYIA